jgi:hypothetical protein
MGILREALAQSDSAACLYIWPSRMEYACRLCPLFLTRYESPVQGQIALSSNWWYT